MSDITGNIPILLIPCDDFIYSKLQKNIIKEIIKHYINCKKCYKCNNNNIEIYNDMMTKKINYKILNNMEEIDNIENMYMSLSNINTDNNIVNIYQLNFDKHFHDKCFFITF
jgi:hypothetical protein